MNLFEKIRNCISDKMQMRNVPKFIAEKVATEFVNDELTTTETAEIDAGRMRLEYNNLLIKRVNVGDNLVNRECLMKLTEY